MHLFSHNGTTTLRPKSEVHFELARNENKERIHSCEQVRRDEFSPYSLPQNLLRWGFAFVLGLFSPFSFVYSVVKNGFCIYGVLLFLAVNISSAFSQTASLPYTTGFESADGYTSGAFPATGKPWTPSGTVTINTTSVYAGTQSLAIAPNGLNASRIQLNLTPATTTNQVVFVDFYLRGVVGNVADLAAITKSGSAVVMALVQTGSNAELYVADGAGNGNLVWVRTGKTWPLFGTEMIAFQRVTARIDLITQCWDLYLDGQVASMDIGFATNKSSLSYMNVRGDASGTTRLDSFNIGTTNPLFTDLDKDGMDDAWEVANGLNPMVNDRDLDKDGDGLTNLQEYVYKTNPSKVDTDGDGISDLLEIQNGTNASSELAVIENFENYILNSLLAGQGKWTGSGTGSATVQGTTVQEGSKAIKITASSTYNLQRSFITTEKGVWTDLYVKPVKYDASVTPTVDSTSSVAAYFDSTGKLRLYDGTTSQWQTVTVNAVDTTQWQRLTFYQDYTSKRWSAWLNNIQVAANLGFKNLTISKLSSFSLKPGKQGDAYLDKLSAGVLEPANLDNDGDGLSNALELSIGSDPNNPDTNGDGISDGVAYANGNNPSDGVPFSEGFETYAANASISGLGKWTLGNGGVGTVQTTQKQAGNQGLKLSGTGATSFIQRNVTSTEPLVWMDLYLKPVLRDGTTTPTLAADAAIGFYFDKDGKLKIYNGSTSQWITTAVKATGDVWQRVTVSQNYVTKKYSVWLNGMFVAQDIGFASAKTSLAFMRLNPGKEDAYLDSITAAKKQPAGLLPWLDSDGNGLSDTWEMANFGHLGNSPTADPDGDGLTNLQESIRGTNPNSATSKNRTFYASVTAGNDSNYGLSVSATDITGPKKTINGAVGIMISGDTTEVASGNYSETKISPITRNLVLRPQGTVKVTPP